MVRNILVIDSNPLIRLKTIMKFVGGSSFITFRNKITRQHCPKHEIFNKNCLVCQRLSSHQFDISEEKQCIAKFKNLVEQSNRLYTIYKHTQDLDMLESIIRKSLGIAIDKNTRTLEKLKNIIRIKKSSVITAKLSREEKECFEHLWTTPHVFIILSDLESINQLLDSWDILDIANSVDNPYVHIFYEIENESQIPENLLEYEINGLMTIQKTI